MKTQYLFVSLAMNQTLFYEKIADVLKSNGFSVAFICFHERSHHYLLKKGHVSHNPYKGAPYPEWSNVLLDEFILLAKKYAMPLSYHLLTHEQVAYSLSDQKEVLQKYVWTLRNLQIIYEKYFDSTKTIVVQELGGFASVVSTYFVSRKYGFDHYFIEPAFFKGRYFLIKNSLAPVIVDKLASVSNPEVEDCIQKTQESGQIVIPFKDRAHYLNLYEKVFNIYNVRRLTQKLFDKYFLGYIEEFRYIAAFARRHLKAFINKYRLKKYYDSNVVTDRPFVYFPLHVPLDVAITFRSPVFKDQLALLDLLCRSCPLGYDIVFKEHPAMVGVLPAGEVTKLLKRYNNLRVLSPSINNYHVLRNASVLVTVNSKSGAEALALGKHVIVLGDAFYTKSPLVHELRDLSKLYEKIIEVISLPKIDSTQINRYFSEVWSKSFIGDVYQLDELTISHFSKQIRDLSQEQS